MGLLYDSSLMADDEPYELLEDGEPTGIVELPVEWIKDDAPYLNMQRFAAIRPYTPPSGVLEIFKAEFDGAGGRARPVPADHAPAHHRPPLADVPARGADRPHQVRRTACGSPPMRRSPATAWRTAAPRADSIATR